MNFAVQDLSQDYFFDKLYEDNNLTDTHEIHRQVGYSRTSTLSLYSDNNQNAIFEDELGGLKTCWLDRQFSEVPSVYYYIYQMKKFVITICLISMCWYMFGFKSIFFTFSISEIESMK